MELRNLKEITRTDSPALTSIIDYWKDYDVHTVILSFAELKRRNYSINEKLIKRINDFCSSNNNLDIEAITSSVLQSMGYNNYEECYEKEIGFVKKSEKEQTGKIEIGYSQNDEVKNKNSSAKTALYILGGIVLIGGIGQFYGISELKKLQNSFLGDFVEQTISQKIQFGSLLSISGCILIVIGYFIKPNS
ncbi:MAG: hypothetical protein H7250_12910 [Flavobacterium sp.]|nr:hypothetical protein [Flavobacterium sp.]